MITDEIYTGYFPALLSGSRVTCNGMVKELLASGTPVKEIYIRLFQRSMYEVGALWEQNKISVATEHMCTGITDSLVNLCYPAIFSADHLGKKAVITCTPIMRPTAVVMMIDVGARASEL